MRNSLYRYARILGDINAIKRGKIGNRLANKLIGRYIVSKLWRR